jgi:pimeloyl-ACP methyl ester carboxylesterase
MPSRRETLSALGTLGTVALASPIRALHAQGQPASQGPAAAASQEETDKLAKVFEFVRARNARDYVLPAPDGIDEGKYLQIGGIEQWVTIRGENRANPVLLLLHGGPGDATNPWGYAGFRTWLKAFTVVQWDQRGTGRTLGRNGRESAKTVSIDRLVQDCVELADALRTSLRKDKIVLLGHSWGSVLGALSAKAKPDLFHAFVGTGQVGDPARNYSVAFDALIAKARAIGDARAVRELEEVGPPPYKGGRGYQVQRRWSNLFEGGDAFIASMLGFALSAPGYTTRDVNDWLDGQLLSSERLVPQSSALAASALTGRFGTPVFVIQGAEDFTTPTSLAKEFLDGVEAPRKAFRTIEGGHFAVFMEQVPFLRELTGLLANQK